jgi:non-ribosomal peptide synthase protein (TIGR01720 family)
MEKPGQALVAVKEQLRRVPNQGINYGALRYSSADSGAAAKLQAMPQAEMLFRFLGDLDHVLAESPLFGPVLAFGDSGPKPHGGRRYLLEITGSVGDGCLRLTWAYDPNLHRRATIQALARSSLEALRALIAHCQAPNAGVHTLSDFAEFEWDEDYFADVIAEVDRAIE